MQSFSERIFSQACGTVQCGVLIFRCKSQLSVEAGPSQSIMNAAANEFGEMLRHAEWTVDTAGPHLAL